MQDISAARWPGRIDVDRIYLCCWHVTKFPCVRTYAVCSNAVPIIQAQLTQLKVPLTGIADTTSHPCHCLSMQRQQTKTVKKLHSIEELLQPRSSESKFSAAELKSVMETQLEVDARKRSCMWFVFFGSKTSTSCRFSPISAPTLLHWKIRWRTTLTCWRCKTRFTIDNKTNIPLYQVAVYRDKVLKKNRGDNSVGSDIFADADKREAQRGKVGPWKWSCPVIIHTRTPRHLN